MLIFNNCDRTCAGCRHVLIGVSLAIQRKVEDIKDKIRDDQIVQEQYEKTMSQVVATRIAIHQLIALRQKA